MVKTVMLLRYILNTGKQSLDISQSLLLDVPYRRYGLASHSSLFQLLSLIPMQYSLSCCVAVHLGLLDPADEGITVI